MGAPAVATTFIGRHAEREEIRAAIADDRLVTLLGPGGIGKTRLAIVAATDAAETLPGGATFVDLVPVRAPFLVQAVAAAVGVDEQPGQALQDTLVAELRSRPTLVVLDNCEHLLDVVAPFADTVLAQCPNVRVLATSRERLGLPGERAVRVPPLSMTGTDDVAYTSDAATLFLTRARAIDATVDPDPNVVDELCARLDGMPLAIELAAARTASLGIAGLQVGLDDRLQLLTGGRHGAERHRSLPRSSSGATTCLDDEERAVFRRLGVFVGGFDLDAAHAVASGEGVEPRLVTDIVGRLVDKSLVVRRAMSTGERWQLLETIREYALERLEASGEAPEAHARHLAWSAGVAEALEEQLRAGDEGWRPGFEAVIDDLRSALTRAPAGPGPDASAFRVAHATGQLAYARHFLAEAQAHYESASDHAPNGHDAAAALNAAAGVGYARMRIDLSYPLLLQAADRAEADGDAVGAAKALARAAAYTGRCIGELPEPIPLAERSELLNQARAMAPADDDGRACAPVGRGGLAGRGRPPVRAHGILR